MQQEPSRIMTVLLPALLNQAPVLLALLGGLVVALALMTRCRGPATVAAIGIAIQLLALFLSLLVQVWAVGDSAGDLRSRAMVMSAIYFVINLGRAAGMVALIGAVFMGRAPTRAGIARKID